MAQNKGYKRKTMKKIIHQKQKCIGCGNCVAMCPKFFEMGEDGRAHLKDSEEKGGQVEEREINAADEKCAEEAKEGCPADAIQIKEG